MIMKQKMITYSIVTCLTITLFTNCSKTNTPETIASVQQKIKGNWQVVRETTMNVSNQLTKSTSLNLSASDRYNVTADSIFPSGAAGVLGVFTFAHKASYKVISPNQLKIEGVLDVQIQTLTNSNCILYSKSGNDSVYTAWKTELKK